MLCVYKAMLTQTKTMDLTKAWKHRVMQRLEGCVAMCLDPLVPEKDLIVPVFGLDRRETVTVETVWEVCGSRPCGMRTPRSAYG